MHLFNMIIATAVVSLGLWFAIQTVIALLAAV